MSIRYVAYCISPNHGEWVEPDGFDSAARAWAYWGNRRADADIAWVPSDPNDPYGPKEIDQTQALIESFERKAQDYGILGTGEVLDEPTGIVYGVRAED